MYNPGQNKLVMDEILFLFSVWLLAPVIGHLGIMLFLSYTSSVLEFNYLNYHKSVFKYSSITDGFQLKCLTFF